MTTDMDCRDVRPLVFDYQRGRLAPDVGDAVRAHLETCAACARDASVERALTDLLEHRLPQHAAPLALKRRLAAEWPEPRVETSWWSRWRRSLVPAIAVAAVLLTVLPLYYQRAARGPDGATDMVREAVNDHLRIVESQRPLDVSSGGIHQVKPWFTGRLDFAPVIAFDGDDEFPLQGGALGYFLDRKAAVFVYRRRLHTISLFVFRAEGLPWQSRDLRLPNGVQATATSSRGFNVVLWRAGDLGYALVSDVDARELQALAIKLSGS